MNKKRVLIADDHDFFRQGMRNLLETESDFEVVGEAVNCKQVNELAKKLEPDVILMDILMPQDDGEQPDNCGIEATRMINEAYPLIRILMVTMFIDGAFISSSIAAGALGYLLKGATSDEILRSVRTVYDRGGSFSPEVMEYLRNQPPVPRHANPRTQFLELTDREFQVLEQLAQGYNNPEIANKLTIEVKTVNNHVSNIYSKLEVSDRRSAIKLSSERGLKY